MDPIAPPTNKVKETSRWGVVIALACAMLTAFMGVTVQKSSETNTIAEIIVYRTFWITILLFPFVIKSGQWRKIFWDPHSLHLWARSVFGGLGLLFYYSLMTMTSVSTATMLYSLSPIFVVILSFIFLKERFHWKQWVGICMALAAVSYLRGGSSVVIESKVLWVGLVGALISAMAYSTLRVVSRHYSMTLIVFLLSATSCLGALPFVAHPFKIVFDFTHPWLMAMLLSSLVVQILLTWTYRLLPATVSSVLTQSVILWATAFDVLYLHHPITLDMFAVYLVAFLGLYLVQSR